MQCRYLLFCRAANWLRMPLSAVSTSAQAPGLTPPLWESGTPGGTGMGIRFGMEHKSVEAIL